MTGHAASQTAKDVEHMHVATINGGASGTAVGVMVVNLGKDTEEGLVEVIVNQMNLK